MVEHTQWSLAADAIGIREVHRLYMSHEINDAWVANERVCITNESFCWTFSSWRSPARGSSHDNVGYHEL